MLKLLVMVLLAIIGSLTLTVCGPAGSTSTPRPERAAPTEAMMAPTMRAPTAAPRATVAPRATAAPRATLPPVSAPPSTNFQDNVRQRFVSASVDNVSTFSLDTDRTSYYLALNWARSGYEVDPDSVRAEEWVNAFDYGYNPPRRSDSFAISSDIVGHPLYSRTHLARIALQAPEIDYDATPVNVTLVLDASGSMGNGNRLDIAREAAESIRLSLRDHDRIAVVHFSDQVLGRYTVEHRHPDSREVARSISDLYPTNATNVQAGLDKGVQLADRARRENPNAYNYIILMSDGVANVDATDPFAILESAGEYDRSNPLRLITIGGGHREFQRLSPGAVGSAWKRLVSLPHGH